MEIKLACNTGDRDRGICVAAILPAARPNSYKKKSAATRFTAKVAARIAASKIVGQTTVSMEMESETVRGTTVTTVKRRHQWQQQESRQLLS